jgi:hypothetical protein
MTDRLHRPHEIATFTVLVEDPRSRTDAPEGHRALGNRFRERQITVG